MRKIAAALLLIAACRTAPPPKEVPAAALIDRSGDSIETAIAVPADAPNGGVDFENDWLYARFGTPVFRRHRRRERPPLRRGEDRAAGRRAPDRVFRYYGELEQVGMTEGRR
jgi:hypothetical protein